MSRPGPGGGAPREDFPGAPAQFNAKTELPLQTTLTVEGGQVAGYTVSLFCPEQSAPQDSGLRSDVRSSSPERKPSPALILWIPGLSTPITNFNGHL